MIDEILYLEPDEEITSVIEKIKDLKGSSISLVIPKNATLIASVINLRLLEREAKKLKKKVAIVTQDRIGRKLAAQVGIPVYESVTDDKPIMPEASPKPKIDEVIELEESAPQKKEEVPESPVPVRHYGQPKTELAETPITDNQKTKKAVSGRAKRLNFKKHLVTLSGLVVIGLAVSIWWFLAIYPRATVKLILKSDAFEQTVQVKVDNSVKEVSDDFATIPGQTMEVKVKKNGNFSSTGEKEIGTNSTGKINLKNKLGEGITLPAGTTFTRDGFDFRSGEVVKVPAATVSIDSGGNVSVVPGESSVSVESVGPGEQYNLGAGSFAVSGLTNSQQEKFEAANSQAFTGGSSQTLKIVNENDLEKAKDQLADGARDELKKQLEEEAAPKTVISDTIEVEVVESNANKNPGDEADNFDLEVTIRARTIVFDFSDFEQAIIGQAEQKLPSDRELVVDQNEDKIETRVEDVKIGEGVLNLIGVLSTKVVAKLDQESIKSKIVGQSIGEAELILGDDDGIIAAEVQIRPSFRQSIPKANQIVFDIERE
ncbi:hypothetical protein KC644_00960 [Candidatus Berkelbacteria bacterium]|nr:hypothetical protein [Candidatus Berkelbacteria bacterium]